MSPVLPTIAILALETDGFWNQRSLIHLLMPPWKATGWNVEVVTDLEDTTPAEIALLHVSLSVVPETHRRLAERFPRTINGTVLDIRKRRFSRLLVDREGTDPGPVIVKTDWNSGGWRELRESAFESSLRGWARRLDPRGSVWRRLVRLEMLRPWHRRRVLLPDSYPVFPSRDLVPDGVWQNPNLVVERFAAERQGDQYLCRHWLFFGSREVTRRTISPDPVVKLRSVMERTSDSVPEALRRIREEMGFDYGKFDYGIVDGEVVLYDVNRTPGAAADPRVHDQTIEILAPGIQDFLQ